MPNKEKEKCRVCGSEANLLFKSLVLNKYQIGYFKCPNCEFIQTEKPFWLNEAYTNAITDLDIGLVSRNISFSGVVEKIIRNNFNAKDKFLDYAGGYGLFVRLMRDKGFDFYREDKYCENIFAKNYDLEDLGEKNKFELVTAFEVFEHLESPLEEIEKMFKYSDTLIFSTELQINQDIKNNDDWWYFTPETGQHVAFYSAKTLRYIAEKFHYSFYSVGSLHLMSKRKFEKDPFLSDDVYNYKNKDNISSLIAMDFEFAKSIIAKANNIRREAEDVESTEDCNKELIRKLSLINIKQDASVLELDAVSTELNINKAQLKLKEKELESIKEEKDSIDLELNSVKTELELTRAQLNSANSQLFDIYTSLSWKLILILQKIIKTIIPEKSFRRKIAVTFWRMIALSWRLLLKLYGGLKKEISLLRNYIANFKPKKKRKINLKSKKIVYIGHSYHHKTKSTVFLIDYLKEFFDVAVILDESWQGKSYPDLSFIDESYLGVIFFQMLPSPKNIKEIKNNNIVYFPMYDQSGRLDIDFWNNYRDLKIINFSSALHEKLKKWGFESIYVQYFPNVKDFLPGNKEEVFFWQRLTNISIATIIRLLDKSKVKIHIHKAIDPGQEFIQPQKEDEKRFGITYSDWFETRAEMWDVIKQKGIYVAPREYEGIGMSFLEAMAQGKAVVAVNNPTMNEYIENGKTGYLFDLKNPKPIDLTNIEEVQKNTYEFMENGFEKWEKDKKKIIEFIKK